MNFLSILNKYGWFPSTLFTKSVKTSSQHSWVGLEWALPGVVVGVVVPFSVSVGNALELLISDVVVSVGVWSWSVDTFFSGDEAGWLVDGDGFGGSEKGDSDECEFHFLFIL